MGIFRYLVVRRLAVLSLALTPTLVPATGFAHAPVECGDTLTRDTVLKRDLTECPGDGLVIGADDITVDLNGHTIDGTNSFTVGIRNEGHDGVEIKDGLIREFTVGIQLAAGAETNRVHDLRLLDNSAGLLVLDSDGNLVHDVENLGPLRCLPVQPVKPQPHP